MTELQRQAEAHRQIRDRLFNGSPKPKTNIISLSGAKAAPPTDPVRDHITTILHRLVEVERGTRNLSIDLSKSISKLCDEFQKARENEARLKLDVADLQARLLSLADRLCSLEGKTEALDENRQSVREIVEAVLVDYPGVTWDEIKGIRRERRLTVPRQHCMYEVWKQRPDLSLPTIGRLFGGRDHTTVLHSVNKASAKIESDPTGIEWMERKAEQARKHASKALSETSEES